MRKWISLTGITVMVLIGLYIICNQQLNEREIKSYIEYDQTLITGTQVKIMLQKEDSAYSNIEIKVESEKKETLSETDIAIKDLFRSELKKSETGEVTGIVLSKINKGI